MTRQPKLRRGPRSVRVEPEPRHSIPVQTGRSLTRPLKTSETVARDVTRDMISAAMNPGDSLPPEVSMLERYAVSRESLREGLRLLEVQGLISIRRGPGGGPIVETVDPANLGRMSSLFYHMAGASYRELFESWVIAESYLALRAARNSDAALRKQTLSPFLDRHPNDEPLEEFVQSHAAFHAAVASLVGNKILQISLLTMGLIVSHHVPTMFDPRSIREDMEADHLDIARAIIAGHSSRAETLMGEHIERIAQMCSQLMGARVEEFIEWQ